MAALTRKLLKLFGESGSTGNFGVFGTLSTTKTTSKDIDALQGNAAWGQGWQDAVIANKRPAYQDFNGWQYVIGYELFYLFERGIPEWIATQTYYTNSIVNVAGVIYKSIQDTNVNHLVSDAAWWTAIAPFVPTTSNALTGSRIGGNYADLGTKLTINAAMTYNNTAPVITDGIQVLSFNYQAKSTGNKIRIQAGIQGAGSGAGIVVIASLWYGATLVGVQANECFSTSAEQLVLQPFEFNAPTITNDLIQLRVGTVSASAYYVNADGSNNQLFASAKQTSLSLDEFKG